MPFLEDDGSEVTAVALLQRDATRFQLVRGFSYVDPATGAVHPIPAHDVSRPPDPDGGNSTDLASVPAFLWGLIPSYGLQTRAALLHDHLSEAARRIGGDEGWELRRESDRLFRVSLLESGVSVLRSTIMWAGVSADRYRLLVFGRARATLGTLQLVAGVLAIYLAIGASVHLASWLPLLVLLAPIVVALAARRDREYFVVATYLGALVLPIIAIAAISWALFWLLSALVWLLGGRRGAIPSIAGRSARATSM